MDIGFALPTSGAWATPHAVRAVAERAEAAGYSSLWTFQRLLAPPGGELPPVYHSVLDPLLSLSFAAAVTSRVRLGVAVINAPFQSPALLAKQLATLDVLSGGRVDAGLGLGWLPLEFTASSVPMEGRGRRMEEFVACLRALWGPDPVSFSGSFYAVEPSMAQPKPVQPGGPPILLGGAAHPALERAGRISDGWISSSREDPAGLSRPVGVVRGAALDAGRDPVALRMVCRGVVVAGPRTGPLTGSVDEIRSDFAEVAAQGVDELFVDLNFDPAFGDPAADPAATLSRGLELLSALAPLVP